ncbi:MAG: hypothetical protein K6F00_02070 [Lachnospiraceae bacterium]|nr:hypothetical protein [Lachnospiraceae bacterium]
MEIDIGDLDGAYYGIDISDDYTLLSFYSQDMEEPKTVSTVMGSEAYQIPTYISKKRGIGQWFFGNEAKKQVSVAHADGVDKLYSRALADETIFVDGDEYMAKELLYIYIHKILLLSGQLYAGAPIEKLVICVEEVSLKVVELFSMIASRLGLSAGSLLVIDKSECFYYYTLSQNPQIYHSNVMLYDYTDGRIRHCRLSRNVNTSPMVVNLSQGSFQMNSENRDVFFEEVIENTIGDEDFSGVFLTGDGFDGDWMKLSLSKLCKGRRVFLGKNLYSKGACYAGMIKDGKKEWPYVFIGDNELKLNLSIKVIDKNEMQFLTLISAGESWYDSKGECEAILDGSGEFECWISRPESRKSRVQVLELTDLEDRGDRMTRLRIEAVPLSDKKIKIIIRDLGFGEIAPSSGKVWEHTVGIA